MTSIRERLLARAFRVVYFVRHGQTESNRVKIWAGGPNLIVPVCVSQCARMRAGHTDVLLNETGREQARAAGRMLARCPVTHIHASPLKRAAETAVIVREHLGSGSGSSGSGGGASGAASAGGKGSR